jgi:hypothetical protein
MNCFKAESDKAGARLRRVLDGFKGALVSGSPGEVSTAATVERGVDMKSGQVGRYAGTAKKVSPLRA